MNDAIAIIDRKIEEMEQGRVRAMEEARERDAAYQGAIQALAQTREELLQVQAEPDTEEEE